jgi:hypothetical protein
MPGSQSAEIELRPVHGHSRFCFSQTVFLAQATEKPHRMGLDCKSRYSLEPAVNGPMAPYAAKPGKPG